MIGASLPWIVLALGDGATVLADEPPSSVAMAPSIHARHRQTRPAPSTRTPRQLDPPGQVGAFSAWVYGYYANWAGTVADLPWDRLTHVAIFDVGVTGSGTITATANWTDVAAEAVALAEPYGVKIHLAVTSFDADTMSALLGSPGARSTAANALADLVNDHGAHGVSVDFEGMNASNSADLVAFVQEVAGLVEEVTVATPAIDWNGAYDYDALAAASDGLFIMGYDYHWRGGDPGPVAPLSGGGAWGPYALDWSIDDYLKWGATPDKIILGLPLYGYSWPSTGTNVPGTATADASSVLFADAVVAAEQHGRQWDAVTSTPYYFPSGTQQSWYDDTESLDHKIAFAMDEGLRGIGFWAVNYEGGDPAFWDMVAMHTQKRDPDPDPDPGGSDGGDEGDGGGDTGGEPPPDPTGEPGGSDGEPTPDPGDAGDAPDTADGDGTSNALPPLDEDEDAGACACRSGRTVPGAALLGLGLLGLRRRRRDRGHRSFSWTRPPRA